MGHFAVQQTREIYNMINQLSFNFLTVKKLPGDPAIPFLVLKKYKQKSQEDIVMDLVGCQTFNRCTKSNVAKDAEELELRCPRLAGL